MTDEKKTAPRKPRAKKPIVSQHKPERRPRTRPVGVPGEDKQNDNIIDENEFERTLQLEHDVQVYEERVKKSTRSGEEFYIWQPYGRTVPVLLITFPVNFTSTHEAILRNEPNFEPQDRAKRVIRGVIKRHDSKGEIYFELGKTDADADRVIAYAIELLANYNVKAGRAIRFTNYLSRDEW